MSFDDLMKELMHDYVQSLPAKILEIESHWKSSEVEELQNDFHKLKGTGKTYGLPEISQLGLLMENLCRQKPDKISTALPLALLIMKRVFDQRSQNQVVDITGWDEFLKIQKIESP